MSKTIEQAKADLAILVPHLRESARDAVERAKPGACVQFAIIAKNPDGTGQVGAAFECDEFLADMEAVFPPTEDAQLDAAAACLRAKVPAGASAEVVDLGEESPMTVNKEVRERIRSDIAEHCTSIEDFFLPGAKITVLVRNPNVSGDADVLVTNDTDTEILAAIQRRIAAKE